MQVHTRLNANSARWSGVYPCQWDRSLRDVSGFYWAREYRLTTTAECVTTQHNSRLSIDSAIRPFTRDRANGLWANFSLAQIDMVKIDFI